jgi:hypothetical protein
MIFKESSEMSLLTLIALRVFPETCPNLSGEILRADCEDTGLLMY